jgi:hypothetical protein
MLEAGILTYALFDSEDDASIVLEAVYTAMRLESLKADCSPLSPAP